MPSQKNNYSYLIKSISINTGLPAVTVKEILSSFLITIEGRVGSSDRVVLRGFGTLYLKKRKPRRYRDIHTGDIRLTAGEPVPSFTPSKCLIRAVNSNVASLSFTKDTDVTSKPKAIPVSKPDVRKKTAIPLSDNETFSVVVVKSIPNPRQASDLRIGYIPVHAFDSGTCYPLISTPEPKSLIKLPREGRSDIKGYKEADFLASLADSELGVNISDNLHMPIPHRSIPYEPDIVLFDESINLYVDVEIDEPYDGYSRLITHNIESTDRIRDTFFKESGWVVVRFTERQVHLQCDHCIEILKNLINTLKNGSKPQNSHITIEKRWDYLQGSKWEKELYREKYLGIQSFSKQARSIRIVCDNTIDEIDKLIKRTIIHPTPIKPEKLGHAAVHSFPLSEDNTPRVSTPLSTSYPPRLSFDGGSHSYFAPEDLSGNSDHVSVTTLIDRFFPFFDEEAYIQKRMAETGMSEEYVRKELAEPSSRGTDMHRQIELFLKGEAYNDSSKEFHLFRSFYEEKIRAKGLVFDSAEFPIELHECNIAGTVDALFRKPDGEYVMVDWKRSRHLIIDGYPKKYGFGRGLSILSHLDNSSYYKYELQQSFYKYILEKEYDIKISSMILAVLHPDYDRYYAIKLSNYREREVLDMIEAYINIKK